MRDIYETEKDYCLHFENYPYTVYTHQFILKTLIYSLFLFSSFMLNIKHHFYLIMKNSLYFYLNKIRQIYFTGKYPMVFILKK